MGWVGKCFYVSFLSGKVFSRIMTRITRIKILPGFESYKDEDFSMQVTFRHLGRGLKGYEVKAWPVGTELHIDSALVLLIGRNGSGKTTLLKKLEAQLVAAAVMKDKRYDYFELDYEGNTPIMMNYDPVQKPSDLTGVIDWRVDKDEAEQRGVSIRISFQLENVPKIYAWSAALKEVFMNIMLNSIDAVFIKGGVIMIQTQAYGQNLKIMILDSGEGMSKATVKHIFKPFFNSPHLSLHLSGQGVKSLILTK